MIGALLQVTSPGNNVSGLRNTVKVNSVSGALIVSDVRGDVDMRKLCSRLGVAWDPELQVSTISGLVTEMLERIPVAGDTIEWNGFHVEVVKADRRRARLLSIRRQ